MGAYLNNLGRLRNLEAQLAQLERLLASDDPKNPVIQDRTKSSLSFSDEHAGLIDSDLKNIALDIFRESSNVISFPHVEEILRSDAKLDLETLKATVHKLSGMDLSSYVFDIGTVRIDPVRALHDMEIIIEGFEKFEGKLQRLEMALRIEIGLDGSLEKILIAIPFDSPVRAWLQTEVRQKISLFEEDELRKIWAMTAKQFKPGTNEVGETFLPALRFIPEIIQETFFESTDLDEIRNRLTTYLVQLHPSLIRHLAEEGIQTFPVIPIGIGRVLAITKMIYTPLGLDERRFVERITLISAILSIEMYVDLRDISKALGISIDGVLLDGSSFKNASNILKEKVNNWKMLLIYNLKRLLADNIYFSELPTPVFEALWRYKLSLEVQNPESRNHLIKMKEIQLQRHMCKFLMEQGIFSFGTQFGQSQTDLIALRDDIDTLIIEAKVFRKTPTTGQIKSSIVQLQSYMDQPHLYLRGVLTIYNFSDTFVTGPKTAISGRYFVLPINLMKLTPSQRHSSVQIDLTEDRRDIKLISLGKQPSVSGRSADG